MLVVGAPQCANAPAGPGGPDQIPAPVPTPLPAPGVEVAAAKPFSTLTPTNLSFQEEQDLNNKLGPA